MKPPEERRALSLNFRIFLYGFLQVTTIVILAGTGYRYWLLSLLLTLTAGNLRSVFSGMTAAKARR